jgi:hypothetical protein
MSAVDFALLYQPLEAMAASGDYFTYVIKVSNCTMAVCATLHCLYALP